MLQKLAKLKLTLYTLCCTTPLLGERKIMSALIPKTKAAELLNTLGEILSSGSSLTDFQVTKYTRDVNALIKSGVNLAEAWMCQGVLYSLTSRPQEMHQAYENAKRYGATDTTSQFNQAVSYALYGYFEEAAKGYSLSLDDKAQNHLLDIAICTLNFEAVENLILPKFKDSLATAKELTQCLGIDIDQGRQLMELFFSILKAMNLSFWSTKRKSEDGELQLFFETTANENTIIEILSEFDSTVLRSDLFEVSTKITIILSPFHRAEEAVA